jgi:hypothetical protein
MNHKAPPTARRAGLARHLALDHNPLRRRADRLETCIMAGLLAAFRSWRASLPLPLGRLMAISLTVSGLCYVLSDRPHSHAHARVAHIAGLRNAAGFQCV